MASIASAAGQHCPDCGASAAGTAADDGCPYCLLRLGLSAAGGERGTTRVSRAGGTGAAAPAERFVRQGVLPRFDDYELESEIARGGMGVVYRARQRSLNRTVAVELILAGQLASPAAVQRFRLEAEAAARLQHPGIVQVYEVGEVETQHFISMELVDGVSLAECLEEFRLRNGMSSPEKRQQEHCVAELVARVARALDFAHRRGVLHRDLKPSNILIDEQGQPHLTDFGLAKLTGREDSGLTLPDAVLGTPGYLAPEQAAGRGEITTAADVYGLGATLYELLTGKPPFAGATAVETMIMAVERVVTPPRQINPAVDRDLETIALRCLEKDPARRYPSAAAVADELERFTRREPIQARPVSRPEHVWRWCRRNPLPASLIAAVVAVFATAFALVSWSYLGAERARAEAVRQRQEAQGREKAERWERYRSNQVAAASALRLYNVSAARDALEAAPPEHRNWEWRHLHHQLDTAQSVLRGPAGAGTVRFSADGSRAALFYPPGPPHVLDLTAPNQALPALDFGSWFSALSPDGKLVASRWGDNRQVVVGTVAGSRRRVTLQGPAHLHDFPQFSPDGTRLAAGFIDNTVRVWDTATGAELLVLRGHESPPARLAFSPDGRRLASTGGDDRTVRIWDAGDGHVLAVLAHEGVVRSTTFSPGGDRLLAIEEYPSNALRLWNAATGTLLGVLRGHTNQVSDIAFSPDGTRIATSSLDQTARLWDGRTGQPLATLSGHRGWVNSVAFSPDGRRVVSASHDHTVRLWDAADGKPLAVLLGHTAAVFGATYTADGAAIVSGSASGDLRRWDAQLAEQGGVLRGHTNQVYGLAFHPDGVRVASAGWDGTARLWDAAAGRQLALLSHAPGTPVTSVAFHPAGKLLATLARDDAVRLWDVDTATEVHRFTVPTKWYMDSRVAFSPRGDLLATGGPEKVVHVWDVNRRTQVARLQGHTDFVRDVLFAPDGSWLASAGEVSDKTIRVWDVSTQRQLHVLEGHTAGVYALAVSPDGKLLASGGTDGTARLWDTATWKPIATLTHGSNVYGLAFTPDGTRLATGCADNTIRLWDVATRQPVCDLHGHADYVHQLAFSPDGTRLVSGSGDFTVRVWDSLSPQQRAADVRGR